MDITLFGRYFLGLALLYPGAFLCLAPLWEHIKDRRRTAVVTAALVTVIDLAAAALCAIFELDSNMLLLPILLAAFWLLRWRVDSEVSVGQTAFLFAISAVTMAVCTLLSVVLNARAEVDNDAPVCLVSTALLKLGLSAVLCTIFWFTAVQWSRWLLQEYRGEAFWQSAWPLPTIYAAFLVFCMPYRRVDLDKTSRRVLSADAFHAAGGTGTPASWLHTVTLDNLHPQTTVAFRINGLTGSAADYKLFALGTDGLYHEVSGWHFDDAPARLSAKKVYTICVPAQDGGSFDLSPDAKEVTLSIVLAR